MALTAANAPEDAALDLETAARGFAAIGSEPRLEVLLALVRAGPAGLSVGDIQARLDIPASTLTHHLKFLAAAELIDQRKHGRMILNSAAFEHIEALVSFLTNECCRDAPCNSAHTEHMTSKSRVGR